MKRTNNYGWLVCLIVVLACSANDEKSFIMPDGNIISSKSIHEFQNYYNIEFEQYHGFVGETDEKFFGKFVILPSNHLDITSYIISEQKIHETLNEEVVEIRFEKILTDNNEQLKRFLKEAYDGKNITIREENNIYQGLINQQLVFEFKYIEFGVPGYFLIVYPI